ncbi:unnamed protein product [Prunus brigantina]
MASSQSVTIQSPPHHTGREAHHSPTSAGDDGLASSLLLLGVVLGYAFVLGVRPPNLLNARVRRGWLSAGLMKKLVNCWPHEHTW